jgi:hypothetical protein
VIVKRIIEEMVFVNDDFPVPHEADIRKAIEKSGYVFELQMCPIFEKHGFVANSCSIFQDQDTSKSREIDIYAWNTESLNNRFHPVEENLVIWDELRTDIIVECKHNRAPVVFFTRKPSLGHFGNLLIAGNPEYIKAVEEIHEDAYMDIQDFLHFEEFHHNWRVKYPAYQFGLMKPKFYAKGSPNEKIEWSLSHEDYYDSINKLAKATISKGLDLYERSLYYELNEFLLSLLYPVLLLDDYLLECRINDNSLTIYKTNHIILKWSLQVSEIFYDLNIDIISSSYLSTYLEITNIERKETEKRILKNIDEIRKNISKEAMTKFKKDN